MAINTSEILINGAAYDWASLTVSFGIDILSSQVIFGVTALSYENDMPITNNYGRGRLPVSFGRQNITASASITLSAEEYHKLENISEGGAIQDLPKFDVICQYLTVDGKLRVDTICDCHLTKNGRTLSQNDPESLVEMDLNPSFIIFNGTR